MKKGIGLLLVMVLVGMTLVSAQSYHKDSTEGTFSVAITDDKPSFFDSISDFFNNLFVIGVDNSYEVGENIHVDSFFDHGACDNVWVKIVLKYGSITIDSSTIDLGPSGGESRMISVDIDTDGMLAGTYTLSDEWLCGTYPIVSMSNYLQSYSGYPNPSYTDFDLVDSHSTCVSHSYKKCISDSDGSGKIMWMDSCGNLEETIEDCIAGEQVCDMTGGEPQCVEDCHSTNNKMCYQGNVWGQDSCGNPSEIYQNCDNLDNNGLDFECNNGQCVAVGDSNCCTWQNGQCTFNDGETDCDGEELLVCDSGEITGQFTEGQCGYVTPDNNSITLAPSWTWTEYYSKSDLDLIEEGVVCTSDSDCSAKQDYKVSCKKNKGIEKRIWEGHKKQCNTFASNWVFSGGLFGGLIHGITNILVDPCGRFSSLTSFISKVYSGTDPGVCIAESTTWYGGLWEGTLNTVGGMGIPAKYVLVSTILILMILVSMLWRFV